MPRQAVALKKYRGGTLPASKISDKEDATASLWYAGELSVQDPVGPPVPAVPQEPEEGSKRPSGVLRQYARDVLPTDPAGPQSLKKAAKLEREVATVAAQSRSETGDREILARCAADHKVNWSNVVRS